MSVYRALKQLINLVENGMILTGQPDSYLDEMVRMAVKALLRHRQESEYAETELINLGLSIRHAKLAIGEGALVYQTRHDGEHHTTDEIMEWDDTAFFPKAIVEQMKGMI